VSQEACLDAQRASAQPTGPGALSLPAAWATFCGALAAGAIRPDGLALLRLLASWLVADAALGLVWAQLGALKGWELRLAADRSREGGPFRLPYAEAGAPGARLAQRLNVYLVQRRGDAWARIGSPLAAAGVALVMTTFLGPSSLLITSGALVCAGLVSLASGTSTAAQREWARGVQVAAAWLLGSVALGQGHAAMLLPALWVGLWGFAHACRARADARPGRWLMQLASGGAVAALLAHTQPLPAVSVALAALADEVARPTRSGLPWMASALVLALASSYWA
jgi:hypothetical protein